MEEPHKRGSRSRARHRPPRTKRACDSCAPTRHAIWIATMRLPCNQTGGAVRGWSVNGASAVGLARSYRCHSTARAARCAHWPQRRVGGDTATGPYPGSSPKRRADCKSRQANLQSTWSACGTAFCKTGPRAPRPSQGRKRRREKIMKTVAAPATLRAPTLHSKRAAGCLRHIRPQRNERDSAPFPIPS